MFKGKDHIHPFNGGATTLKIMKHYGIIKTSSEDEENEFEKIMNLIEDSTDPI